MSEIAVAGAVISVMDLIALFALAATVVFVVGIRSLWRPLPSVDRRDLLGSLTFWLAVIAAGPILTRLAGASLEWIRPGWWDIRYLLPIVSFLGLLAGIRQVRVVRAKDRWIERLVRHTVMS